MQELKHRYYVKLGYIVSGDRDTGECLACGKKIKFDGYTLSGTLYHEHHGTSREGEICHGCLWDLDLSSEDAFNKHLLLLTRQIGRLHRLAWEIWTNTSFHNGTVEVPTAEELREEGIHQEKMLRAKWAEQESELSKY